MKKIFTAALIIVTFLSLTGCGPKKVFDFHSDDYVLTSYSVDELIEETFYVKDGSKFYEPYEAKGDEHILYLREDNTLVPSIYKDGIIAVPSTKTSLNSQTLTRYKYLGYSIGIYGMEIDEDGYLCFSRDKNVVKNSSAEDEFYTTPSADIRIVSINDTPVSEEMISSEGVFLGMEEGGIYKIAFYAGSYYDTVTVTADYIFLEEYETYETDKSVATKNGYLAIHMPEDLPSGYYAINEAIFKYYAYEKGTEVDAECDMNEVSTMTETERISANSQQYRISVKEKTNNTLFSVSYDPEECPDEEMECILIAPDETMYEMVAENGVASIELAEVIAGSWIINIKPKDLSVSIDCKSTLSNADALSENYDFEFTEEDENIQFVASYEGDGNVWGIVTYEDGTTQTLDVDTKNKVLTTTYAYVKVGTYRVTIYHYNDTEIKDVTYQSDEDNEMVDIIIIEE